MIGKATVDLTDEDTDIEAVREHVQKYTDEDEFTEMVNAFNFLISTDLNREEVEDFVKNRNPESEISDFDIEGIMLANKELVAELEEDKENEDVFGVAESMEMINEYFYKGSDKYSTEELKELKNEYSEASDAELTLLIPL